VTGLHRTFSRLARTTIAGLAALACTAFAAAPAPLPGLSLDPAHTSVSGLSSGGFMAVQLHVAYSGTFRQGAGIVAGGPFHCADGSFANALGRCMSRLTDIPLPTLVQTTTRWARDGLLDPLANLKTSRVYLFSGTADTVVRPHVVNDLFSYYKSFVPEQQIAYRHDVAAEHAMVTDDAGSACATKGSPFINDCDIDLAGAILKHLYGTLQPRNDGALGGTFIEFDQTEFVSGHGMAKTGWLYVPQPCAAGTHCRLHVVLHGCQQNSGEIGQKYVRDTGYNRWADSNRIVLLYPQTGEGASNGCWDWWGYDSRDYSKKSGPQMAAIKAMVDRLASHGSSSAQAAPAERARGAKPAAKVKPDCVTSSNYAHVAEGRAYVKYGVAYAKGSDEAMGLWNIFVNSRLKSSRPGYYEVADCD
jgi:poly(3-hydroxybutyrate) depolymerase